ncbi:hypothetical protein [Paenibacillus paridis]|uniref:hypothetical protein n=1 Tax=Paenibacillus paridis TaxID=2583376 RepID=UPI0011226FC6|nr:hypothetical protein [Paenibacillus paridis]
MSEFTSGSLVMNKHRKAIEDFNPTLIKPLNDKWSVFFTKGTEVSGTYPEDIIKMTTSLPILYFYNFEDHGWGFTILYQSRVISAFDYSYEADAIELHNYVQERFPEEDAIELLYIKPNSDDFRVKMFKEFYKEHSKEDKVKKLIKSLDVDAFALFNIDSGGLDKLRDVFSMESLMNLQNHFTLINDFKETIDIKEMCWIRADRIENLMN